MSDEAKRFKVEQLTPEQRVALCIVCAHTVPHSEHIDETTAGPAERFEALALFDELIHDDELTEWIQGRRPDLWNLTEHPTAPKSLKPKEVLRLDMTPVQAVLLGGMVPIMMEQLGIGKEQDIAQRVVISGEMTRVLMRGIQHFPHEFREVCRKVVTLASDAEVDL